MFQLGVNSVQGVSPLPSHWRIWVSSFSAPGWLILGASLLLSFCVCSLGRDAAGQLSAFPDGQEAGQAAWGGTLLILLLRFGLCSPVLDEISETELGEVEICQAKLATAGKCPQDCVPPGVKEQGKVSSWTRF